MQEIWPASKPDIGVLPRRSRADGVLVWEWGHAAEVLASERSRADGVLARERSHETRYWRGSVLVWEWGRAAEVLARERSRADGVLARGSTAAQTGCWCVSGAVQLERRWCGAGKTRPVCHLRSCYMRRK